MITVTITTWQVPFEPNRKGQQPRLLLKRRPGYQINVNAGGGKPGVPFGLNEYVGGIYRGAIDLHPKSEL